MCNKMDPELYTIQGTIQTMSKTVDALIEKTASKTPDSDPIQTESTGSCSQVADENVSIERQLAEYSDKSKHLGQSIPDNSNHDDNTKENKARILVENSIRRPIDPLNFQCTIYQSLFHVKDIMFCVFLNKMNLNLKAKANKDD